VLERWHVDLPLASGGGAQGEAPAAGAPTVHLQFGAPLSAGQSSVPVSTDVAGLRLLVHELKQAREVMQQASADK
jgi:hypothetical protein